MHLWGNVIAENRDMKCLEIPEIEDLFKEEPVPLFQYKKSYEEAKNDPLFIIQTSGTTGMSNLLRNSSLELDTKLTTLKRLAETLVLDYWSNGRL